MKKLILLLLVTAFWLSGCSNYQYYAIQSDKASFSKYRTFAWLPAADSLHYNDVADEKIKDEITAGLEKRGLLLRTGRPDLLVRYHIQIKNRVRIYNNPTYIYGPAVVYRGVARNRSGRPFYYHYAAPFPVYLGNNIEKVPYKEGTLIIDLIDRAKHQVIWRGYGVGDVDNPERAFRDIPEAVEGILNKLPLIPLTPAGR